MITIQDMRNGIIGILISGIVIFVTLFFVQFIETGLELTTIIVYISPIMVVIGWFIGLLSESIKSFLTKNKRREE